LEQISEATQEEENEDFEEWLNTFSQEAEEAARLKLIVEEAEEQADKLLTPWEMELEMLEDWLNNPEPAGDFHEQVLAEEHSEDSLRNFSQGAKKVMKNTEMKFAVGWQFNAIEDE
jgi:16S rRNA U1498 N3-methylase RsmE